jgi:hypothetical protein
MKKIEAKSSKTTSPQSKKTNTKTKKQPKKPAAKTPVKKATQKIVPLPRFKEVGSSLADAVKLISEDAGQLLGNVRIQEYVDDTCQKIRNLGKKDVEDPRLLLENLKELAIIYTRQINFREGSVGGAITKYRIQQGMLFLAIKKAVRFAGKKWSDWFKENFSGREFRSVQEFMQLAKKPSSMTYAVLGKDRLLKILRLNKEDNTLEDPIGDFLKAKNLEFNPEDSTSLEAVKNRIDVEINYQKLLNAEIDTIPKEKVQQLVDKGKQIFGAHIRELQFLKDTNGDLLSHMDTIIDNGGKAVLVDTPERKAQNFKSTAERFLKVVDTAMADGQFFPFISIDTLRQLKTKIEEMEQLLPQN